jgi:proton-dependent oligopeptide transporter, POT family
MLSINLMDSTLVTQAGTMQTHGLPNDIMYNLNPISVMVFSSCPFSKLDLSHADQKENQLLGRAPYRRGPLLCPLAIAYTTGIQHLIYMTGPCLSHSLKCFAGNIPNDVSVGLQTPTYVFLAWAEQARLRYQWY